MNALHARPKAGSAAKNQYGTFQVRYATQKQTNYIAALLERKDVSGVDPKVMDVAGLWEQVNRTEVNKTAASDIIDFLLSLPDIGHNHSAEQLGAPATAKQKDFVRSLLAEREGNAEAEAIRQRLNKAREEFRLTLEFVSGVIGELLEIHPVEVVPAGRYALPAEDGHFVFYKVDTPTEGKWAGYTFVSQLIGSVGDWSEQRLDKSHSKSVLHRIAADVEEAARMFGLKARACGHCLSPLSNVQSRAAGYGETCANNHGYYYPSKEEAQTILSERGED